MQTISFIGQMFHYFWFLTHTGPKRGGNTVYQTWLDLKDHEAFWEAYVQKATVQKHAAMYVTLFLNMFDINMYNDKQTVI